MSEGEDQPYHKKLGRELCVDGLKHINLDDLESIESKFDLKPDFKWEKLGKRKNEEE